MQPDWGLFLLSYFELVYLQSCRVPTFPERAYQIAGQMFFKQAKVT